MSMTWCPLPELSDASPSLDITPALPPGHAVGLSHWHVVDSSREDISTGKREFMVSAFYAAQPDVGAPRARLTDILQPRRDNALQELARDCADDEAKAAAFATLQSLTLRAQPDLSPLAAAPRPVLIYYPGGMSHRLTNAGLCEALADCGYIVFVLDAPRDAPVVVLPHGGMVLAPAPDDESYIWPRVADVRFLLDQLTSLNDEGPFAGLLDLSRIGMFGHSRGGYLSNICAVEDARIRAAANMDGFLWGLWVQSGTGLAEYTVEFQQRARALSTPILRLRGDQGSADAARHGFEEECRDFGGPFLSVALHGFNHGDFGTTPWMSGSSQNFLKNAMRPTTPPAHIALLIELLADFFDTYLAGIRPQMTLLAASRPEMDVFFRC